MACLRHSVVLARGCEVWNGEARSACDVGQGGPTLRLRGIGCPRLRFGLGLGDKGGADDPAGGRFLASFRGGTPRLCLGGSPTRDYVPGNARAPSGREQFTVRWERGKVGKWEGGNVAVAAGVAMIDG